MSLDNASPLIELDDLAVIFGYNNRELARKAIYRGTFPVPVFKVRNVWVCEKEVVKAWLLQQREEGMKALKGS